jgi:enoyl-[acyl-carrier protein] reductase I
MSRSRRSRIVLGMNAIPCPSPRSFGPLAGRTGLVMGLADAHSIAWGCARVLRERGARLVLSCVNEKARAAVQSLADELEAPLRVCNVEQDGAVQALVSEAGELLDGLDFAVHSIAWAPLEDLHGRVADSSAEGFARAMRVSCHSFAELARCAEAQFRDGGTLITMSYLGAEDAVPRYGLMGPVKAALESLVRYLALELGPQRIRVHAVSPGPLPTRAASGLQGFEGLMEQARRQAPLRRLATLDEVGGCVAFLVGSDATGMTGQTLYVDAGVHAVR